MLDGEFLFKEKLGPGWPVIVSYRLDEGGDSGLDEGRYSGRIV